MGDIVFQGKPFSVLTEPIKFLLSYPSAFSMLVSVFSYDLHKMNLLVTRDFESVIVKVF